MSEREYKIVAIHLKKNKNKTQKKNKIKDERKQKTEEDKNQKKTFK